MSLLTAIDRSARKSAAKGGIYTITTTGNADNVDFGGVAVLRCDNATLLTIRGLAAGYAGQIVTILSVGAGNVELAPQNASSTAENRLINAVTVGNTPLAAGFGMAMYLYDPVTLRWRLIQHIQGTAITPSFAAGNFTGNGSLTVTVDSGDLDRYSYYIQGNLMIFGVQIRTFTTGGTPNTNVQIAFPGGFNVGDDMAGNAIVINNGAAGFEQGRIVFTSVTTMAIQRAASANWANGTNNNQIYAFPAPIPLT